SSLRADRLRPVGAQVALRVFLAVLIDPGPYVHHVEVCSLKAERFVKTNGWLVAGFDGQPKAVTTHPDSLGCRRSHESPGYAPAPVAVRDIKSVHLRELPQLRADLGVLRHRGHQDVAHSDRTRPSKEVHRPVGPFEPAPVQPGSAAWQRLLDCRNVCEGNA